MTMHDRYALIRAALTPDSSITAPADLGDAILAEVAVTRQRSSTPWLRGVRWVPSPAAAAALLVLAAMLLVAAIGALSRLEAPVPLLTTYHGGPDRTGVMPGPGPAGLLRVAWESQRNGAIHFTVMPLVADDLVVVADDGGFLTALDEATGAERWSRQLPGALLATPVILEGLVVAADEDGAIGAFALADGSPRWEADAGGPVSASLSIADGGVLISTENGGLVLLEPATGAERWRVAVDGPIVRGPAVAGGVIFVGTENGSLLAVDAATQRTIWARDDLGPNRAGTPAVVDGRVYVGLGLEGDPDPGTIHVLDARTGADVWSFAIGSVEQVHVGAVGDGRVFGVSTDATVIALAAADGRVLWTIETGSPNGALAGLAGDSLFVSSGDGSIRSIDVADGSVRWTYEVAGDPTIPVVIDGRVFVGTSRGLVVSIAGTAADEGT